MKSRSATRCQVACSRVAFDTSGRNCFGNYARDNGHKRAPTPPDNMTGVMAGVISPPDWRQAKLQT